LVERRLPKPKVAGSTPVVRFTKARKSGLFVFLVVTDRKPCPQYVPSLAYDSLMHQAIRPPTGHVFRLERKRAPVWYAKYRLPDGRQVQKKIGPAWTERGRAPAGYFTKRTAEQWLRDTLDAARRGRLPGLVQTGSTFADAAAEWLRYVEHDRDCKASTLTDYRSVLKSHLLPAFGDMRLEDLSAQAIENWRAGVGAERTKPLSNRTRNKALTILGGILERARKVHGLPSNPAREVEKLRERYDATRFAFYSPEEVHALARAAASPQDAAIFLTAAFTGLRRGELIALRWRDVDFDRAAIRVSGSFANGKLTSPKSGHGRVVPMVPDVAAELAKTSHRDHFLGDDDLVFPGDLGGYLDGSALRRRFVAAQQRAGLRRIRFHDLRHTFGTLAVRGAESIVELQAWMGHAEVRTTMRYTHYREQQDAAERLAVAFRSREPAPLQETVGVIRPVITDAGSIPAVSTPGISRCSSRG
jgi:integrase